MGVTQESRDELQRTKDEAETRGEELEMCKQQGAELEMRLGTVQVRWTWNSKYTHTFNAQTHNLHHVHDVHLPARIVEVLHQREASHV